MTTTRIRELRNQCFMTQAELATKTGLTIATISRLERGAHRAHVTTIRRLASALGVPPQALVERGER